VIYVVADGQLHAARDCTLIQVPDAIRAEFFEEYGDYKTGVTTGLYPSQDPRVKVLEFPKEVP
jgi:hypothetical protein